MQTVLVITSAVPGAVCVQGRLAGEIDAEHPLCFPSSPSGPLILELRPFSAGYLPLTVRLTLSGGILLPPAAADSRLCAALWPGGIIEAELCPESIRTPADPVLIGQVGDMRLSFLDTPALFTETPAGRRTHPLPDGAQLPSATPIPAGVLATGALADGGEYAAIVSADGLDCPLLLTGRSPSLTEDGAALRLIRPAHDSVGHGALETWTPAPGGWRLTASEPVWADGAPAWPKTPEETAVAAIESAQLGLMGEAAGYLAPGSACMDALTRTADFDGCVPLRYGAAGRSAVGLMRLQDGLLHIIPAFYEAVPGGLHGAWQLTRLEVGESH